MNTWRRLMRFMIVRLYVCLLPLYPNHFRTTFNDEIQYIFLKIVIEAEEQGGFSLLNTSMRELNSLVASIIKERWHELKSRKEKVMTPEENLPDADTSGGGGASSIEAVGMPGWKWIPTSGYCCVTTFPVRGPGLWRLLGVCYSGDCLAYWSSHCLPMSTSIQDGEWWHHSCLSELLSASHNGLFYARFSRTPFGLWQSTWQPLAPFYWLDDLSQV